MSREEKERERGRRPEKKRTRQQNNPADRLGRSPLLTVQTEGILMDQERDRREVERMRKRKEKMQMRVRETRHGAPRIYSTAGHRTARQEEPGKSNRRGIE